VLPLGFRFDVDAVVIGDIAHRSECLDIADSWADEAIHVLAGEVHRSHRCPRECARCRPPFETLLTHQLEREAATPVS
jgi:hypothetical protein